MPSRSGKIARLPLEIREELNIRLLSGERATNLVPWLNAQPAVQSLLSARFGGIDISEQNISNWVQGGFVDWCVMRDWEIMCHACVDDSAKIAATGIDAGKLLVMLTGRLAVTLECCGNDLQKPIPENATLHKLIASVLRIQQGELKEARLALDRERLEFEREKHRSGRTVGPSGKGEVESGKLPAEATSTQSSTSRPAATAVVPAVKPAPPAAQARPMAAVPAVPSDSERKTSALNGAGDSPLPTPPGAALQPVPSAQPVKPLPKPETVAVAAAVVSPLSTHPVATPKPGDSPAQTGTRPVAPVVPPIDGPRPAHLLSLLRPINVRSNHPALAH